MSAHPLWVSCRGPLRQRWLDQCAWQRVVRQALREAAAVSPHGDGLSDGAPAHSADSLGRLAGQVVGCLLVRPMWASDPAKYLSAVERNMEGIRAETSDR